MLSVLGAGVHSTRAAVCEQVCVCVCVRALVCPHIVYLYTVSQSVKLGAHKSHAHTMCPSLHVGAGERTRVPT